ncbi:aldehyde dehydrogenase [Mesorhizobium sp. DCY119]|uniref:aldehyde dehydrogenase n=1 Tax=Mesorhizobium sp. DCY119 TaxID=2108445 RepID=UPI001FDF7148|nr:aldehyde dehydrogenase [Mesorhizobium sp. DCY119]
MQNWHEKATRISFRNQAFINGKWVASASGKVFEARNPATNHLLASIAECDVEDVNRAVAAARKAFDSGVWSRASPETRKTVLVRLAELIRQHQDELALLETLDTGKPIANSVAADIPGSAATFQWFGEAIDKVYGEIAPTELGNLALVRRDALGVVACVVPWNYPLMMASWKVAPALAAGNSVVLKPAEQTSLTALRLAELAVEAGLPYGVLNVVTGFGETAGQALGRHMDVDCLAFTGSTEVGKYFLRYSAESNMKPVWLECGGKSPNLVFSDCDDIEAAADAAAFGIWYDQGEVCTANSRLLVEEKIKDEFVDLLKKRARDYQPGDPLDPTTKMGAVVEDRQTARILSYIEQGKSVARLVEGGEQLTISGSSNYVTPTIFDGVTNDMVIAREEIFGPVLSVLSFREEEEAARIANASIYGLAASIWSNNLKRVMRLSDALRVGTISVNCMDAVSNVVPFGGFKQSGNGRDLSLHSFDKYTNLKTVWIKY